MTTQESTTQPTPEEPKPPRSYEWGELQCGQEDCDRQHHAYYDKETEEIFAQVDGRPLGSWMFCYQGEPKAPYMTLYAAKKAAETFHRERIEKGPRQSPLLEGFKESVGEMLDRLEAMKPASMRTLPGIVPAALLSDAATMPACTACGGPALQHVRDVDGNYPCTGQHSGNVACGCKNYEYTKGETLAK